MSDLDYPMEGEGDDAAEPLRTFDPDPECQNFGCVESADVWGMGRGGCATECVLLKRITS
jgi:hypothetical protein